MRPFSNKFPAAALCAVFALHASIALVQPTLADGANDGSASTPPVMNRSMPGRDQMPTENGATMTGRGNTAMSTADAREQLHFPPQMRTHMLGNMRDHVEALDGILRALALADYDGAAQIATEHLGLDSPSAAACKPKAANAAPPPPGSMDAMMALYMPETMRAIGLEMHTSASQFAVAVKRAAVTRDNKTAIEALSRVTQNCVACHAGYRLQ